MCAKATTKHQTTRPGLLARAFMSLSPLSEADTYTTGDNPAIVHVPTREYSTILGKHVPLRHDRHLVFRSSTALPVTIVNLGSCTPCAPGIYVCNGLPVDVSVGLNSCTVTVDLHEAMTAIHRGTSCSEYQVTVSFAGGAHTATTSCSATLPSPAATICVEKSTQPHGIYFTHNNSEYKHLRPANGQIWATTIADNLLLMAPFDPTRGFVCGSCSRAFVTLQAYHTHCSGAPGDMPPYSCLDAGGKNFCRDSRYPTVPAAHANKHSVITFKHADLCRRLAGKAKRTRKQRWTNPMLLQVNPFA